MPSTNQCNLSHLFLVSGTYARMASCDVPAENIIFPMCPEPPLRSSSFGSDFAFIAFMHSDNISMSPSGSSTEVQKNSSPPMSAAPSISTPRFPPSFTTFFNFAFRSCSISSGVFSGGTSSFGASFLPCFFPSLFATGCPFFSFPFFSFLFDCCCFFWAAAFVAPPLLEQFLSALVDPPPSEQFLLRLAAKDCTLQLCQGHYETRVVQCIDCTI